MQHLCQIIEEGERPLEKGKYLNMITIVPKIAGGSKEFDIGGRGKLSLDTQSRFV